VDLTLDVKACAVPFTFRTRRFSCDVAIRFRSKKKLVTVGRKCAKSRILAGNSFYSIFLLEAAANHPRLMYSSVIIEIKPVIMLLVGASIISLSAIVITS
jgi:hypothetical protein